MHVKKNIFGVYIFSGAFPKEQIFRKNINKNTKKVLKRKTSFIFILFILFPLVRVEALPNFLLTKLFLNYILIVYLQLSNARQIREGVKKPKVTDQSVNGGGKPPGRN